MRYFKLGLVIALSCGFTLGAWAAGNSEAEAVSKEAGGHHAHKAAKTHSHDGGRPHQAHKATKTHSHDGGKPHQDHKAAEAHSHEGGKAHAHGHEHAKKQKRHRNIMADRHKKRAGWRAQKPGRQEMREKTGEKAEKK